jgi:YHS domain-containing protein
MVRAAIGLTVLLVLVAWVSAADQPAPRTPKEALQPFNSLIGSWRATGQPEGTFQEKQRGFWTESDSWGWQFKGNDAWLKLAIDKGKYFTGGELHYLPEKAGYRLILSTPGKESLSFEGSLKQEGPQGDRRLILERTDAGTKEMQRLTFTFLHANRFVYRYEVKPPDRPAFKRVYEVGVTKEGVAFAGPGDNDPECIVSGGKGTISVVYKGQTYYVCCTGCRDAFKEDPEKYLKEYAERKAKEAKEAKQQDQE